MNRLEIIRGRPSEAPALVKHAVRFGRRLREHGVYGVFPALIDTASPVCKVAVGRRIINLFEDGSATPSLRSSYGTGFEREAFRVQRHRMHAIYLAMAAEYRRIGRKQTTRAFINYAIEERTHERTSSI